MNQSTDTHSYLFKGSKVNVLGAGLFGTITRITKAGIVSVRVKSRWGNHHHAATSKTFRYPKDRIAPDLEIPTPTHKPTYD